MDLKTLSTDNLNTIDIAELAQPWTSEPTFDPVNDPEVDPNLRLSSDLSFVRQPPRRLFIDYRSNADAYRHLETLPGPEETLHGVISGKYALFELIPAMIERQKQPIDDLHIATLSFNRQNATDLLGLLDDGHVKRVSLLISYYYKSTSREIYDSLVPHLRRRGQRVLAMRTHAKILLIAQGDNRWVVESSANLRSSVNIEQFTLTNSPALYNFHRDWMENLLNTREDLGD